MLLHTGPALPALAAAAPAVDDSVTTRWLPDPFPNTLSDGRGGSRTAAMHVKVIQPTGKWSTTSFSGLAEVQAGGAPIRFASAVVPRAVDWDADGRVDLLVGAAGGVTWFRNLGTAQAARATQVEVVRHAGIMRSGSYSRAGRPCPHDSDLMNCPLCPLWAAVAQRKNGRGTWKATSQNVPGSGG